MGGDERQRHRDGERDTEAETWRWKERQRLKDGETQRKERNKGPDLPEVDAFLTFLIMSLRRTQDLTAMKCNLSVILLTTYLLYVMSTTFLSPQL